MFRIGFCYIWGENDDPRPIFTRLKSLGYDGIELWDHTLNQRDFQYWKQLFDETGIACAQLCPYFNFVDGQDLWDESMRVAERYINWSLQLGNPIIRVFTGKPWGDGVVGPDDATQEQWDAAIRGLQRICDMAAPHDIRFALECHMGSLMEDTPNTLRLLNGVNRPNLGLNLQLPLKDGREDVQTSLDSLGRYTWHMHSHNYSKLVGGEQVYLSDGVMDYTSILTQLLTAGGFSGGYVSIEHGTYNGTRNPWEVAEHEAAYLIDLRKQLTASLALQ